MQKRMLGQCGDKIMKQGGWAILADPVSAANIALTEYTSKLEHYDHDHVKEPQPPLFENQVLTVKDAAKLLRVTTKTIYKKVRLGEIPHKKVGSEIRFLLPQLIRWLKGEIYE